MMSFILLITSALLFMIILFLFRLAKGKKAKRGYNQVDLFFFQVG